MLNLTATTDKIQVVTDAAVTVDVNASGLDLVSGVVTPWKQNTAISTATTTDVVAAPAGSTVRNVKALFICNKHATTPVGVTVLFNQNGTTFQLYAASLAAGALLQFVEGVGWYYLAPAVPDWLLRAESADETGQNVNTAQPWFPTAGGVTITANTSYYFSGQLSTVRSAGSTSHTTGLLYGGTASVSSIQYRALVNLGDVDTNVTCNVTLATVATNTTVKAASTSTTEAFAVTTHGFVRFGAAGTFIPQFIYSAAPGGAPTIRRNSYFRMDPFGSNTLSSVGPWA